MSGNHAGSLEHAKEIIHAAKEAGADCVKIQTYTADTLTIDCDNEYFHIDNGTWKGENLYKLYEKAYTPWEWQKALREEADKIGIDFFSTPFDKTSVDFLEGIGVDFYKMALSYKFDTPEKYSETYWEMANIYDNTKDYDNAEKYLLEYINKAKSTESKSLRKSNLQKAYYQLTRMYISLKDYKKALLYNEENLAIDSSLHKEIIDAELKYLLKQYPQSLQEVEKINLYNINEFSGHPLIYFARNSVINVLAYSKINPNDTEGAKKLNSEKNEFFNSIIQSIINDKSLDFDNKKHNIRRYCK